MPSPGVRIERQSDVLTFTLANPAAGNEVTGPMFEAMLNALEAERREPHAKVLRIRAEGEVFCLGRERSGQDEASIRAEVARLIALKRAVLDSPLISIAQVQGNAAGFGTGLAVVCDFTVVAEQATLSFPEMRKGLPPAAIMAYLGRYALPKRIFPLLMLGKDFTARHALEIGLVTQLTPRENLAEEVDALIAQLLARDPDGLRQCKAYFHAAQEGNLADNFSLAIDVLTHRTLQLMKPKH